MTNRKAGTEVLETLRESMQDINDQFGDSLIQFEGTSARWPDENIIRSGSLQLDMATGVGGLPRGRQIMMYGEESCGKTTLALHAVRELQQVGGRAIYIDAENALDPNYMRTLGVDLPSLLINQPPNQEAAINLMMKLMESSLVDLIVLDSIAGLEPEKIMEGDAEDETIGLKARRWSNNLPKLARAARESNTTIIYINQTRENLSSPAMPQYRPPSLPGGKALKFQMSLMVEIKKVQPNKNADPHGGLIYQEGAFKIPKNKVGTPYKQGSFFIARGEPIDWAEDVVISSVKYELTELDNPKKNWRRLALNKKLKEAILLDDPDFDDDEISVFGAEKFINRMREYPNLLAALEDEILNTLNGGSSFIDNDTDRDDEEDVSHLISDEGDEEENGDGEDSEDLEQESA